MEDTDGDTQLSMMERRPWTRRVIRRLPWRYRDLLPETSSITSIQTQIPLISDPLRATPGDASASPATHMAATSPPLLPSRITQFFRTQLDKFGLFRLYTSETPPSHDPEEHQTMQDLCDDVEEDSADTVTETYGPYPNRSAFRLGDWYWTGGAQKSQASFKDLVDIVGDPDFSPDDIRCTNWDEIDRALADGPEWIDEDNDACWEKTPISILVPSQHHRGTNADTKPQQFTVPDFFHRSLVSVVREKLSNPADVDHFHYDPYNLKWQPGQAPNPVNVYGELYTSPAFIEAHRELQSSPTEPNCTLSRHIVGLMFYSDSTHLTAFGDTKLWPLYLYFGNESKYRRCKPSCHLGNHVAYFQGVR